MTSAEERFRDLQAGVADVLRSIIDAPADPIPTLQTIIEHAVRICGTDRGYIYLRDGEVYRHLVDVGATPEIVQFNKDNPITPTRGTSTGRAVIERKPVHIPDVLEDPEYVYWVAQELGGFRSLLSVPMLHEDGVIGVISVYRNEVEPFADEDIDLLGVFAEQASLAIVTSQLVATVASQRAEMARFLPEQVADLVSSPEGASNLEGHRSEITVVFCDLRGFTAFAATSEPEEVMSVLGDYHREMGKVISQFGGTLNAFDGDGLMIYFNDPTPMPDHANQATSMALSMHTVFADLADGWARRGFDLGLGIGIATGYATLGRMGYEGRHHYGPIGTIVNLASRLCDEAESGQTLMSQRTMASIDGEAGLVGNLGLKGFASPVPVYEAPA